MTGRGQIYVGRSSGRDVQDGLRAGLQRHELGQMYTGRGVTDVNKTGWGQMYTGGGGMDVDITGWGQMNTGRTVWG